MHEKHKLIIIATTDKARKIHPISFCISSGETIKDYKFAIQNTIDAVKKLHNIDIRMIRENKPILVCDGASAINAAFGDCLGEFEHHFCYFHVVTNIKKKLNKLGFSYLKKSKHPIALEILSDIKQIYYSRNLQEFQKVNELFIEKWDESNPKRLKYPQIKTFMDYYEHQWPSKNWFCPSNYNIPATNCALESLNNATKKSFCNEKSFLGQFISLLGSHVKWYSSRYHMFNDKVLLKVFHYKPIINDKLLERAFLWKQKEIPLNQNSKNDLPYEFISSQHLEKNLRTFDERYITFEEYVHKRDVVHRSKIFVDNNRKFVKGICDCKEYSKFYTCIHIVGISFRLGALAVPFGLNKNKKIDLDRTLTEDDFNKKAPRIKKCRGRPRKMPKALENHQELELECSESDIYLSESF